MAITIPCNHCDHENELGRMFCGRCGERIDASQLSPESIATRQRPAKIKALRYRLQWTPTLPDTSDAIIRATSTDPRRPGTGFSSTFSIGLPNLDVSTPDDRYVLRSGDAMTGPLTHAGDPT